jgi:hypothetical protein
MSAPARRKKRRMLKTIEKKAYLYFYRQNLAVIFFSKFCL